MKWRPEVAAGPYVPRKMKTASDYQLSFIVNTVVGSALLMVALIGHKHDPSLQIFWSFVPSTIICWFIASLHYSKYLSLKNTPSGGTDLPLHAPDSSQTSKPAVSTTRWIRPSVLRVTIVPGKTE